MGERRLRLRTRRRQELAYDIIEAAPQEEGGSDAGEGSSQGLPLVVLHGGPGLPSSYLRPLGGGVDGADGGDGNCSGSLVGSRRVVFYDQLGCGGSEAPEDDGSGDLYSKEAFVEDLLDVLGALRDAHGVKACHLFAHSWGGILALQLLLTSGAQRRPQDAPPLPVAVRGVVLCGCGASMGALTAEAHRMQELIRRGEEMRIFRERLAERERLAAAGLVPATPLDPGAQKTPFEESMDTAREIFFERHACRVQPMPECLQEAMREASVVFGGTEVVKDVDLTEDLMAALGGGGAGAAAASPLDSTPVLVLRGDADYCTATCVAPILELLPNAEEAVIADAGHYPMLDNPAAFRARVAGFLRRHDD